MTPEQFTAARAAILASNQVLTHTETTETEGNFSTSQVALSYSYAAPGLMTLAVTAKHGLVRFASEDTIKQHLQELLAQV
jgi:hypothetical protein